MESDEPDSRRLFVAVDSEDEDPPDARWLRRMIWRVCRAASAEVGSLNVIVVDDGRMAELHERYRGEATSTDVLSFDLRGGAAAGAGAPAGPGGSAAIEGEVYICLDEARRRAGEYGHPVAHELLLYAAHGLLHLIGYDDRDPEGRRLMHRREDELLGAVGVGPVYHADGGTRS